MSEQPEALRLADALENTPNWQREEWNSDWKASVMQFSREPFEAAAELRRLHEEVEANGTIIQYHEASIARLTTLNQELLEALRVLSLALEEAPGRLTPKQRSVWEKSRDVLFSGGGWA